MGETPTYEFPYPELPELDNVPLDMEQLALAIENTVSFQEAGLASKQSISEKGAANGYASLGADSKVPAAQLPALPARLGPSVTVSGAPGDDANNAEESGWHYVSVAGTNKPAATDWYLEVIAYSTSFCVQVAHSFYSHETWRRVQNAGSWSAWVKLTNADGTAANSPAPPPPLSDAALYGFAANHLLTGGGVISYSTSGRLKWSYRFITISRGSSYYNIECPSAGTVITGVGGAPNDTLTSEGFLLNSWQSLYYIPPLGLGPTSVPANFRVVSYTGAMTPPAIPPEWVLIASHNADQGLLWVTPGIPLRPGESTGSDPVVTGASVAATGPTRRGKLVGLYGGDGLGSYDIPLLHWNDVLGKYVSPAWSINLCKTERVIDVGYGPQEFHVSGSDAPRTEPCWIPSSAYHNMGLQLQLKYIVCGWMQFTGGTTTQTWRAWINYQNNTGGSWGSNDLGDGVTGITTIERVQGGPWINVPTGYTAYSFVAPSLGWYGVGTGSLQVLLRSASVQCRWVSQ